MLRRAIPLLAVILAACGGGETGTTTTERTVTVTETVFTTPGASIAAPASGPLSRDGFREIAAGLRRALGRDPLLLAIGLYDEYAWFRVYDRATGYADDYNWRDGVFDPPRPYKLGSQQVEDDLFALEEVALDGPYRFMQGVSEIELEGAGDDSPYVSISRGILPGSSEYGIVMRSSLDGTRHYVSVTGDSRGRVVDVQRS